MLQTMEMIMLLWFIMCLQVQYFLSCCLTLGKYCFWLADRPTFRKASSLKFIAVNTHRCTIWRSGDITATHLHIKHSKGGWGAAWRNNGTLTPLHPEDMVSVWVYLHCDNYSSEFMTGLDDQNDIRLTSMRFSDLILIHMETINHFNSNVYVSISLSICLSIYLRMLSVHISLSYYLTETEDVGSDVMCLMTDPRWYSGRQTGASLFSSPTSLQQTKTVQTWEARMLELVNPSWPPAGPQRRHRRAVAALHTRPSFTETDLHSVCKYNNAHTLCSCKAQGNCTEDVQCEM